MATRADITPELLRQLLRYEPETGKLFWKPRTQDMFQDRKKTKEHECNMWNSSNAGREAFTARDFKGYAYGKVFNLMLKAHRAAWAIHSGRHPEHQIDHINGIPDDNRLCNLREASSKQNSMNRGMTKANKSGVVGVHFVKDSGKWRAAIRIDRRGVHIGYFGTIEEAAKARQEYARSLGFHPNHGLRKSYSRFAQ